MAFEVDVARHGGADVLTVRGELDVATAPHLTEAAGAGNGRLIVDLTEATFLDSTGLRALIRLAKDDGRDVAVVCPPGNRAVLLVLELSGFDTVIERFESLGDAGIDAP